MFRCVICKEECEDEDAGAVNGNEIICRSCWDSFSEV